MGSPGGTFWFRKRKSEGVNRPMHLAEYTKLCFCKVLNNKLKIEGNTIRNLCLKLTV